MGYFIANNALRKDGGAVVITKEAFLMCYEEWVNKPRKESIKSGRKPKIDWDKACALKQAGWKNKDIASEVGASEKTIGAYIIPHYEEYIRGKRFTKAK